MASPVSLETVRGGLGPLTRYFSIEIWFLSVPDLGPALTLLFFQFYRHP